MPKFEFRFDIATILLASVLTVLSLSAAEAGRKGGSNTGEFRSPPATDAVPTGEGGGESDELNCEDVAACLLLAARKGGGASGEFRSPPATDAVPTGEGGGESDEELTCEDAAACVLLTGRKGGSNAGEFRHGSGAAASSGQPAPASSGQHARPEKQATPDGEFTLTGGALGGVINRFGR